MKTNQFSIIGTYVANSLEAKESTFNGNGKPTKTYSFQVVLHATPYSSQSTFIISTTSPEHINLITSIDMDNQNHYLYINGTLRSYLKEVEGRSYANVYLNVYKMDVIIVLKEPLKDALIEEFHQEMAKPITAKSSSFSVEDLDLS